MQLFNSSNKKTTSKSDSNQEIIEGHISGFRVVILSTRQPVIDNIKSILYLYNVLSIEILSLKIDDIDENPRWSEFDVFIIDINDHSDAEKISSQINRFIPIKTTTILVGNNDSIIFSEILAKKGIHFLLEDNQLDRIPDLLYTRNSSQQVSSSKRIGSVITFFGCKGGIGTSSLIVHVLKKISESTNYPILYIQGASTSRNADFIFEQPIDKDGSFTDVNQILQVKIEQDDEVGNYDYLDTGSFNITIFDQNLGVHSSFKNYETMVNLSNIIIFVINRDPYSVKIAKNALEELNRIAQKNKLLINKRFMICLNDNQPVDKKASLQNVDIEEYLGRKIDFSRRYITNPEKFKKAFNDTEIDVISKAVIGIEKEHNQRSVFSFLANKKEKKKKK